MKKVLLTAGIIVILSILLIALTGCGESEAKGLVGSWAYKTSSGYIYKFNSDKTGSYTAYGSERTFTYEDSGTQVTILYDGDTDGSTFDYRIEDKTLIIKDSFGNDVEYVRQ